MADREDFENRDRDRDGSSSDGKDFEMDDKPGTSMMAKQDDEKNKRPENETDSIVGNQVPDSLVEPRPGPSNEPAMDSDRANIMAIPDSPASPEEEEQVDQGFDQGQNQAADGAIAVPERQRLYERNPRMVIPNSHQNRVRHVPPRPRPCSPPPDELNEERRRQILLVIGQREWPNWQTFSVEGLFYLRDVVQIYREGARARLRHFDNASESAPLVGLVREANLLTLMGAAIEAEMERRMRANVTEIADGVAEDNLNGEQPAIAQQADLLPVVRPEPIAEPVARPNSPELGVPQFDNELEHVHEQALAIMDDLLDEDDLD